MLYMTSFGFLNISLYIGPFAGPLSANFKDVRFISKDIRLCVFSILNCKFSQR